MYLLDIDECMASTPICTPVNGTVCINTPGSFSCQCDSGYQFRENNRTHCYGKLLDSIINIYHNLELRLNIEN